MTCVLTYLFHVQIQHTTIMTPPSLMYQVRIIETSCLPQVTAALATKQKGKTANHVHWARISQRSGKTTALLVQEDVRQRQTSQPVRQTAVVGIILSLCRSNLDKFALINLLLHIIIITTLLEL